VIQERLLDTGAGVPEVNGNYFEDSQCDDDVMCYTKEGTFEGQSGKFYMLRAVGNSSKKRRWWYIRFCYAGETVILFYKSAQLDESGIDTIPHNTWMSSSVKLGVQPMPRVLDVRRKVDSFSGNG
jgi:ubiquitin